MLRESAIVHLVWAALLALVAVVQAQTRPYIGYVYPAGGQQGTTFRVKLGGQGLDDVDGVMVTGFAVSARVVEYFRRLNPQEIQLLNEQLKELKRATSVVASAMSPMMKADAPMMASESTMMMSSTVPPPGGSGKEGPVQDTIDRIEKRIREYVQTPACASIASLVIAEVAIGPDAEPGARELRLTTLRGVSTPLVFHVGQLPEHTRKPMITANLQVLGKEASALRKRPTNEVEVRITLPCTVNGQVASGEVNRYRFDARKGQRLVISTQARELVPYVADAVPGWFQPVLTLYDAQGKEVAFADDYRFKPDPVILFEVPKDGEYVFAITDAIYRGREDFVYRISAGELPFVSSIFPLGGQVGTAKMPKMKGWNLDEAALNVSDGATNPAHSAFATNALPGTRLLVANRKGLLSNPVPFVLDKLPTVLDTETNNTIETSQKVTLPVVVNGRIDRPDDWDVFRFRAKSNDLIAVAVQARRLDSPLDSVIKLTDTNGQLIAFSDDREDLGAGVNTHHADSWLTARLPADGRYYVHIGDTARKGGSEYGYRLRISAPQPDFALRVVPSSVAFRSNSTAAVTVYAVRQDGFSGPIKLALKDPPAGFSAASVTLAATQTMARFTIKTDLVATKEPVSLAIGGSAKLGEQVIRHEAIPAEDRMQAFLWRHLVPANELKALVFDPGYQPPPKRAVPTCPQPPMATNALVAASAPLTTNAAVSTNAATGTNTPVAAKPKFTKQQVARRLRELKLLYEEGLLTDGFYCAKVAECEAGQ